MRAGTHTPVSKSITVAQAAEDWIKSVELEGREASTLAQYRQHAHHITERIGNVKLASLTTPRLNDFRDDLLATMSRAMARKVLSSLKSLLRDAQRRGNVAQNVALASRDRCRQARRGQAQGRRRHSDHGRDQGDHRRGRALAAAAADCDLHRAALVGAARPALARRRSQERRAARAPARRPLQRDRQAEVEGR